MALFLNAFIEAFPQFKVEIKIRPDGTLLLIFYEGKGQVLCKAISGEALCNERCARRIIRELQRDLKLATGDVVWHGCGIDWVSRELPTYFGGPLQMTASKTLVERRKLEHQRRFASR